MHSNKEPPTISSWAQKKGIGIFNIFSGKSLFTAGGHNDQSVLKQQCNFLLISINLQAAWRIILTPFRTDFFKVYAACHLHIYHQAKNYFKLPKKKGGNWGLRNVRQCLKQF